MMLQCQAGVCKHIKNFDFFLEVAPENLKARDGHDQICLLKAYPDCFVEKDLEEAR